MKSKIGIIGAGSWGIALGILLANNNHQVSLYSAFEKEVKTLRTYREAKDKLPGIKIPLSISIHNDLEKVIKENDICVLAVPSIYMRQIAKQIAPFYKEGQIMINVAKGIEDDTLLTQSQITKQELPKAFVAVLSGPSHAEEVSRQLPTTIVVGAESREVAEKIQDIFANQVFRVYTSSDIFGIELGGSLKNVIALAAGIADGLGYGDNTKAALITRGIKEIASLGEAAGGKKESFYGLTGLGDLIVTCASVHSRNRKAGYLIEQGYTLEEAIQEVNMVVEGVHSVRAALQLASKYNVEMPIVEEIYKILFENKGADEAVLDLMLRDKKAEMVDMEWK